MPSLKKLYIQGNQLTNLPAGFGHASSVPNLTELDLSDNHLTSLLDGFATNLPNLIFLNLCENKLTSLPDGFGDASSVPNLIILYLRNNQLTSLPDGFGQNLPNLKYIYIDNNKLKSLPHMCGFGYNLPNLRYCFILSLYINKVYVLQQTKELLLNRSKLISELSFKCSYPKLIYKKVLKIISKELNNLYARIYIEYAYKPPYGLVPNRLMKEDGLIIL